MWSLTQLLRLAVRAQVQWIPSPDESYLTCFMHERGLTGFLAEMHGQVILEALTAAQDIDISEKLKIVY